MCGRGYGTSYGHPMVSIGRILKPICDAVWWRFETLPSTLAADYPGEGRLANLLSTGNRATAFRSTRFARANHHRSAIQKVWHDPSAACVELDRKVYHLWRKFPFARKFAGNRPQCLYRFAFP
jgi:hypothetical protein